jgi:hypothetical protein
MNRKTKSDKATQVAKAPTLESLYHEFLDLFYAKGDRRAARKLVKPLEQLANSPKYAHAIRAEEVRSLLAEFRGDLTEAVRCREVEIRRIYELHGISINTPSWELVKTFYSFSDVGDRLDLLALLYDRVGNLDRAIDTLHESKQYCEEHGVPFDGQDILDELTGVDEPEESGKSTKRAASRKSRGAGNGAPGIQRAIKGQSSPAGNATRKQATEVIRSSSRVSRRS